MVSSRSHRLVRIPCFDTALRRLFSSSRRPCSTYGGTLAETSSLLPPASYWRCLTLRAPSSWLASKCTRRATSCPWRHWPSWCSMTPSSSDGSLSRLLSGENRCCRKGVSDFDVALTFPPLPLLPLPLFLLLRLCAFHPVCTLFCSVMVRELPTSGHAWLYSPWPLPLRLQAL